MLVSRALALASVVVVFVIGCSSGGSGTLDSVDAAATNTGTSGGCPDTTGTWKVTKHCDASLVGSNAVITQKDCKLSFAAPFNGFTGTIDSAGKVTLSGPQSCTGNVQGSGITMACTPGTCAVELAKSP
ncbi:MAG: hypothetical protein U0235_05155 [Polyangiaceae bacterium]